MSEVRSRILMWIVNTKFKIYREEIVLIYQGSILCQCNIVFAIFLRNLDYSIVFSNISFRKRTSRVYLIIFSASFLVSVRSYNFIKKKLEYL